MKKYLIILLVCLFISTPVFAACSDTRATISLYSNNLLDSYNLHSYRSLIKICRDSLTGRNTVQCGTGLRDYSYKYGISTFQVVFDNKPSNQYYGYCIDPGYRWYASTRSVCCDSLDTVTSKAVQSGFIYLLKIAGGLHRYNGKDSQEALPVDLAIRLYAMLNGISRYTSMNYTSYSDNVRIGSTGTTADREVVVDIKLGNKRYNLEQYINYYIQFDKSARASLTNPTAINNYIKSRMRSVGYGNFNLTSFISGVGSQEYLSQAYTYLRRAVDTRDSYSEATPGGSGSISGRLITFDEDSIDCDSNYVRIAVDKDSGVDNLTFLINNEAGIQTRYINGYLYIDKNSVMNTASCDNGDIVITADVDFTSPRSTDAGAYICHANSGSGMQQIVTYDGSEGNIGTGFLHYSTHYTIVIPNRCSTDSLNCGGEGHGRCVPSGEVEIKSSINNCCYDPNEGNTSTVSDVLSYQTVDDPLDINELFLKDPKLRDPELKSLVKCGTQEMTQAPDFQTRSENATTEVMNSVCQMYCMERAKIITPPPVTVTAGRYFELDFTKMDIQAQRKCRISVDLVTVFQKYISLVRQEIVGFDGYYYNHAHELLYQTLWDNGFHGLNHENMTLKIPVKCKRIVGSAFCQGDGLKMQPRTWNLTCTGGVSNGGTLNRTCDYTIDALKFNLVSTADYPYLSSALWHDVGQNGTIGYDQPNTFITAEVNYAGDANFRKGLNTDRRYYGFFANKILNTTCNDLQKAAGNPDCWCPDGTPVRAQILWYKQVKKCKCGDHWSNLSRCNDDPLISGCYIHKVWEAQYTTNSFTTGSGQAFKCEITADGLDTIDYIKNESRGYYPNFEAEYHEFETAAQSSYNAYIGALNELKVLEASFRECLNFFTDGYGAQNMDEHYDVSKIQTSFEYDQVYSTESGGTQTSTTLGKISHDCHVELVVNESPGHDPGFETSGDSTIRLDGLHRETLYYQVGRFFQWSFPGATGATPYFTTYDDKDSVMAKGPFEKKVTIDAVYVVSCEFKDEGNNYNTLVPGGNSLSTTNGPNYVSHEKLMSTHLTTYEGKHEILYHITGLGSQIMRQFDRYFQTGETCSGRNSGDYLAPASCYIDVKQKLVTTGTCSGVGSATNYDTACSVTCAGDGNCSSIYNFVFKMADDTDLFPTGLSESSGWGKNWLTTEGQTTRSKIELDGSKDKTYAPENLTYSYMLTPKTIEAIKKYNAYQINDGGYNDFDLTCNCNNGANACIHCQSKFLSNLAQTNSINSVNVSYVSPNALWTNSSTIQEVRNANHNWDKDTTPAKAVLH